MDKIKKERNKKMRKWRRETHNISTFKYEKTINGFLMRLYRNMQSRVTGIQKLKQHLYKNLELLDRQEFYKWAKASKEFKKLYDNWVENNYDRKLTPSVDRVDSSIGYRLSNMKWVTHSENSRRGAVSRNRTR